MRLRTMLNVAAAAARPASGCAIARLLRPSMELTRRARPRGSDGRSAGARNSAPSCR